MPAYPLARTCRQSPSPLLALSMESSSRGTASLEWFIESSRKPTRPNQTGLTSAGESLPSLPPVRGRTIIWERSQPGFIALQAPDKPKIRSSKLRLKTGYPQITAISFEIFRFELASNLERRLSNFSTVSTHLPYGVDSPFLKKLKWRKKRTPTDSQPPSKEGRPFY